MGMSSVTYYSYTLKYTAKLQQKFKVGGIQHENNCLYNSIQTRVCEPHAIIILTCMLNETQRNQQTNHKGILFFFCNMKKKA